MTKQEFKKILSELVAIKKDEDNLNEAFKRFEPDFNYISFGRYETIIVDILRLVMNDKADWVGYFLYERNGEFTNKKIITDKNGKKISFKNYTDLYDLIKMR